MAAPAAVATTTEAMAASTSVCARATRRRLEARSTTAPMPSPNSSSGVIRTTPTSATRDGDPVRSNISQPSTANSPVRTM